jgi:2-phosphosulfolactate phosphatase
VFSQDPFSVRFDWGLRGAAEQAGKADVLIVVDVLSFSTCVDVAVGRGASAGARTLA